MNEDGFFEVGCSEEEAAERMMESEGGRRCRTVMLTVLMLPPQVTEVSVVVPDEHGQEVAVASDDETDMTVRMPDTGEHAVGDPDKATD